MTVSVKSLQKQLIAAVAMVLVAMIALGSSTYAWFAQNTTVTADTLSVTATTAANLGIKHSTQSSYGTSIKIGDQTSGTTKSTMHPSTIVDVVSSVPTTAFGRNDANNTTNETDTITGTPAFYVLAATNTVSDAAAYNSKIAPQAAIGNSTFATEFAAADFGDYVIDNFSVNYTGGTPGTANLKIEITRGAVAGIDDAFHIGLKVGTTFYNLDCGGFTVASDGKTRSLVMSSFLTGLTETGTDITLYAWYEGEDDDCTTNKAISTNAMQVVLTLSTETLTVT